MTRVPPSGNKAGGLLTPAHLVGEVGHGVLAMQPFRRRVLTFAAGLVLGLGHGLGQRRQADLGAAQVDFRLVLERAIKLAGALLGADGGVRAPRVGGVRAEQRLDGAPRAEGARPFQNRERFQWRFERLSDLGRGAHAQIAEGFIPIGRHYDQE